MPKEPNKLARMLVPVVILLVGGGGIAASIFFSSKRSVQIASAPTAGAQPGATTPPPPTATTGSTPASPTTPGEPSAASDSAQAPATPGAAGAATPAASAPAFAGLHAAEHPRENLLTLGDLTPKDKGGRYTMRLQFSPNGAGVEQLTLADHFEHADRKNNQVLQKFEKSAASNLPDAGIVPFAADSLEINGQRVALSFDPGNLGKTFWKQTGAGAFEATIVDAQGSAVARINRAYEVEPGSHEFRVRQSVTNLSSSPLRARWQQFGPADPPLGTLRYGGDTRRVRFGYLPDAGAPGGAADTVHADESLMAHASLLEGHQASASGLPYWPERPVWPNAKALEQKRRLVWLGMTSRYFAVSMQGNVDGASAAANGRVLTNVATVERWVVPNGNPAQVDLLGGIMNFVLGRQRLPAGAVVLKTISPEVGVEPGQSADFSFAAYAGPMLTDVMGAQPTAGAVGLREVVSYTFGGPCGFCTFQSLTHLLLHFLEAIRGYITHDWALAIMLLVVCVRTILHPVTRWSQINMLRFGKQMQRVGPKMKIVQEKFKGDPQRLREEVAKLNREEGVNYMGMLGCLPMFLQTPVWIALSAMLFFAFELRHEPAFFGVFQRLSGGGWQFLADLAEPDHLISFGRGFPVPILSGFIGPVESINILPLLMGVLFYIQQKYMSPPQAPGTLSPEMEQQQKIMKVMMVVMFPVFMYNAPSGLALYFLTNSLLGIMEGKWIRSHVDKSELERKPTTGQKRGWLDRFQERVADAQRIRAQQMKLQQQHQRTKKK